MSEDLGESELIPASGPAFPQTVLIAGIIWIVFGCLIFLCGALMLAVDPWGPLAFWGLVFGAASVYVGAKSVFGTARGTWGNSIGSIVFALLVLRIGVRTLFGVLAASRLGEETSTLLLGCIAGGLTTVGGLGFLAAGVLALMGRRNYQRWHQAQIRRGLLLP